MRIVIVVLKILVTLIFAALISKGIYSLRYAAFEGWILTIMLFFIFRAGAKSSESKEYKEFLLCGSISLFLGFILSFFQNTLEHEYLNFKNKQIVFDKIKAMEKNKPDKWYYILNSVDYQDFPIDFAQYRYSYNIGFKDHSDYLGIYYYNSVEKEFKIAYPRLSYIDNPFSGVEQYVCNKKDEVIAFGKKPFSDIKDFEFLFPNKNDPRTLYASGTFKRLNDTIYLCNDTFPDHSEDRSKIQISDTVFVFSKDSNLLYNLKGDTF